MSAREEVLRRVREAVRAGGGPAGGSGAAGIWPATLTHRRSGEHPPGAEALVELVTDRLLDYRAAVVRCGGHDEEVGAAVRRVLQERGAAAVVVPPGLPQAWRPAGALEDGAEGVGVLGAAELDALDAVVTGCAVAVAETGTIVLDGSPVCGRRAVTLVPDLHVCVLRADQVVQTVPEALALVEPTRPLTLVSGPSATSDIELDRVEGVHGPRTLVVVLAASAAPPPNRP